MAIVSKDGFMIDDETGEVFGHAEQTPEFAVTDLASAEWVLEKMQAVDFDIAGLEMRKKAILANIDAQIQAHRKRRQWLDMRFGNELRVFAAEALEGQRAKTLTTPFGKLAFRRTPARLTVIDEAAALAWAEREAEERFSIDTGVAKGGEA